MSRQKYLQDLLAVHQARLEELKKSPPVKSSFGGVKKLLGIEKAKTDKPEIRQEFERLEVEIRKLQAELKKIAVSGKQKPADPVVQREILSTIGFAPELTQTLRQTVALMKHKNKQVMTIETVLQVILLMPELTAHRLLSSFSQGYGFNWNTFSWYVEQMRDAGDVPTSNVDFVTDKNEGVPLARELLAVLNKGAAIAKSLNESHCNTAHLLAAIAGRSEDEARRATPNGSLEGAVWLFQRAGITQQVVTEALTGYPVPAQNEQQHRPTSPMLGKTKEPADLKSLGDMFIAKVIMPLDLGVEAEAQIRAECEWLFAAIEHYRRIQQVKIDLRAPVPMDIPPTVSKKDPRANNTVLMLDSLSPFNYGLVGGQIESLIRRINTHFNNLNQLLNQEASLPDAVPVNVALKNQIKGTRRELAKSLKEAAALMQPIYGVMIHSPAELVKFLN